MRNAQTHDVYLLYTMIIKKKKNKILRVSLRQEKKYASDNIAGTEMRDRRDKNNDHLSLLPIIRLIVH